MSQNPSSKYYSDVPEISVREARTILDSGRTDVILLDVRDSWELDVACVRPYVHIPMNSLPDRLSELDPNMEILVFCRTGHRSGKVTEFLLQHGFTNVKNVRGGIHRWADDIDPELTKY